MAWPISESVVHQKPIMDGCVKVNVDKIVDMHENLPVHSVTRTDEVKDMFHEVVQWPRHALKLVNKETASKSTSATRMASSAGSPSCTGASLQIPADDTAMTLYHRSQILIFSNPQPGFQNPFELHALHPKPNPTPEANPEHEPIFETKAELATMVEPAFEDPTLAPALELIKGRPQPV